MRVTSPAQALTAVLLAPLRACLIALCRHSWPRSVPATPPTAHRRHVQTAYAQALRSWCSMEVSFFDAKLHHVFLALQGTASASIVGDAACIASPLRRIGHGRYGKISGNAALTLTRSINAELRQAFAFTTKPKHLSTFRRHPCK